MHRPRTLDSLGSLFVKIVVYIHSAQIQRPSRKPEHLFPVPSSQRWGGSCQPRRRLCFRAFAANVHSRRASVAPVARALVPRR